MDQMETSLVAQALAQFEMLTRYRQQGNLHNTLTLDAVCWRLALGVEALAQVPDQQRKAMIGAGWSDLWSLHNQISHNYRSVSASTLEPFLDNRLPSLMETLRQELAPE